MTVFGCVTATISPTLTSYIRYKGKVWQAAFIASLQTVAGVEYTVYKKKRCWQIKGDWDKIKHAHRILTKVTTVDDWSGHLEREASRDLQLKTAGAAGTPTPIPRRGAARGRAARAATEVVEDKKVDEGDEDGSELPNYNVDAGSDGAEENELSSVSVVNEGWHIKTEPVDVGNDTETTVTTGDSTHSDFAMRPGPPSPVHTPTTESSKSKHSTVLAVSGSRRKTGNPRKVEMVDNEATDDEIDSGMDVEPAEKKLKVEDHDRIQNMSDCNEESEAEESDAVSDDPDFTIDKMVQEGKANLKMHAGKLYPCDKCEFVCKSKSGVLEHQQRQHTIKTLTCPICNKAYGVKRDLRKHIMRHSSEYKCEQCGKTYKEERNYKHHLNVHEKDYVPPRFACDQCEKSFTTKYVLMTHVVQIHRGIVPEWLCTTCGKKFKQKHSLLEHNLIHTGERPFVCKICNKTFRHKGSCVNHEFLHTNVRMYTCEVCGKDFKHRNSLRIHASVHNTERQYACTRCDKKFTQKQALIRHTRIHSGEKPFKCDLCGDRFNDNSILRRHMMGVHKTVLKSTKQHYVLPADHYENTQENMNQQGGEVITPQSERKEEPMNLNLTENNPPVCAQQAGVPPVAQSHDNVLSAPLVANTSTLDDYRQMNNGLFYMKSFNI